MSRPNPHYSSHWLQEYICPLGHLSVATSRVKELGHICLSKNIASALPSHIEQVLDNHSIPSPLRSHHFQQDHWNRNCLMNVLRVYLGNRWHPNPRCIRIIGINEKNTQNLQHILTSCAKFYTRRMFWEYKWEIFGIQIQDTLGS